jgi:hypothetical protein
MLTSERVLIQNQTESGKIVVPLGHFGCDPEEHLECHLQQDGEQSVCD